jgi:hypothetical protein
MRRIETEETREKIRKRNTLIVSVIMLFLLVSGTVGFAFSFRDGGLGGGDDDNSAGGDVGTGNGLWGVTLGDNTVYLTNSPDSVSGIDVSVDKTLEDYVGQNLYVDSSDELIANEIGSTLGIYTLRAQRACFGECGEDLPIKTCEDNLIVISNATIGRVYQEDNCIFIEGGMLEADAFLYRVLGVN